jgi:predicted RNA-binding protein with PUA-like domain
VTGVAARVEAPAAGGTMPSRWLVKSEPDVYSIDDLAREGEAGWEGVRNYQARNFLRRMRRGDRVLFYHSRTAEPSVVGIAEVSREAYPDPTQFDRRSSYHDPRASEDDPRWSMVDLRFVEKLSRPVTLAELKQQPGLEGLALVQKGSRLSVMPVGAAEWKIIVGLARRRE